MQNSRRFVRIISNDTKRKKRSGGENDMSNKISSILLSDKILNDNFLKEIWPKIIDRYADLVEENSKKFLEEILSLDTGVKMM